MECWDVRNIIMNFQKRKDKIYKKLWLFELRPSPVWIRNLGPVFLKTVFPRYGIPMLKIRRSRDRLIFNMGIPILVRRHIYNETAPSSGNVNVQKSNRISIHDFKPWHCLGCHGNSRINPMHTSWEQHITVNHVGQLRKKNNAIISHLMRRPYIYYTIYYTRKTLQLIAI